MDEDKIKHQGNARVTDQRGDLPVTTTPGYCWTEKNIVRTCCVLSYRIFSWNSMSSCLVVPGEW